MALAPPRSRLPENLDGARVSGRVSQRYEDVTQEGRLTLVSLPHVLGELVWPNVMSDPETVAVAMDGVIPILTRMVLRSGDGPISAVQPLWGEAAWHRATVRDASGGVVRLVLAMEVNLSGREGLTLAPPDPEAPVLHVGSVFAEHAYTRLFAPPSERRVLSLNGRTPEHDWEERRPEAVAPGPVEGAPRHQVQRSFGVLHTDPNNHVNSLVYPRFFEEAAILLRGRPEAATGLEVVWRKPFFAGETATIDQWVAPDGSVHGAFLDSTGAARCRMSLSYGT